MKQKQTAVRADLKIEQLLLFAIALQNDCFSSEYTATLLPSTLHTETYAILDIVRHIHKYAVGCSWETILNIQAIQQEKKLFASGAVQIILLLPDTCTKEIQQLPC